MRAVVGALGIALPFVLVLIDGVWFDGDPFPRSSLSAYYYSGVRELFVGALCATGVFLITYKVAERNLDNTLSVLAGLAVLVVAVFPTSRPSESVPLTPLQDAWPSRSSRGVHFFSAGRVHPVARGDQLLLRQARGQAGSRPGEPLAALLAELPLGLRRRHRGGASSGAPSPRSRARGRAGRCSTARPWRCGRSASRGSGRAWSSTCSGAAVPDGASTYAKGGLNGPPAPRGA